MSDNVITLVRKESKDLVYICPACEGQEWKLLADGRIKCETCSLKQLLPETFLEEHAKWNKED